MKALYEMKLHESISIKVNGNSWEVLRVAGGWIYSCIRLDRNGMMSQFIPFNNEFQLPKPPQK